MDRDFKRGLWLGLFSPTPVTPMSWWWEYFDNRGLVPYFQKVREVSDLMLEAGGGSFEAVPATLPGGVLAVRCGDTVFTYAIQDDQDVIYMQETNQLKTIIP